MTLIAPYQALTIGDMRITYVPDGYVLFDPYDLFPTSTAEDWQGYQHLLNDAGQLVGGVGAYVVQSANHTLLVDTAYGAKHYEGDTLTLHGGELLNNLKRAGLEPDDIDLVFYTHFHSDHVGWTSRILDNQVTLTFPKARFLTRRTEWQRFDDPAASRWGLKEALALLAKRIELVENGEQLFPGASVLAAPGHTQGHSALVLTSGKERAIIMGDVFHSALQFEHPEWTNTFDNDPEQAKLTRKKMLQELAQPFTIGIGAHLSTSVFGRLALIQENYQWQVIQLS